MYEVTPQMQRQHLGHASTDFFDDDYDVYLLWHTTSPYVIMPVELVDGYEVALIPNWHMDGRMERARRLSMPSSIAYSFNSDFEFPARATPGNFNVLKTAYHASEWLTTGITRLGRTVRQGLHKTKRRFSNQF